MKIGHKPSAKSVLGASVLAVAALVAACSTRLSVSQSTPINVQADNKLPLGVHSDPTGMKLVWLMTNLSDDQQLADDLTLMQRASKAGYTHVVVSDVKFMKWDFMGEHFLNNVHSFMEACHGMNIKVWACCAPMGYSDSLLMRDPNLAEGLPVIGDFVVDQGLFLKPYDAELKLENGDFQTVMEPLGPAGEPSKPEAWTSSNFGKSVFLDDKVTWNNKQTLRIDPAAPLSRVSGEAAAAREASYSPGVSQSIAVKPFHYYHVHAMIKTQGRNLKRGTQIEVRADEKPDDRTILNYQTPALLANTDWQSFDMTFNALEYSKVKLTLPGRQSRRGGGSGEQGSESIWWADISIEPGQFVNVVRRPGAPLKITNEPAVTLLVNALVGRHLSNTEYVEGKDITPVVDPFLGRSPGAGNYTIWHTAPVVSLPVGSRLHAGAIVHATYYVPAIIHTGQVTCCMCEPKTMKIVKWQIHQIHTLMHPDGYMMGHDELRSQGYDKSCVDTGKSMHQILADNVHDITQTIKREDPGKTICTWSDLWDPFHNAKNDGKRYYLVKGTSPWYGAWTGLDPDVIIMNWHGPFDGNVDAAMKFFSDLGNPQILSGFYDSPIGPFQSRLDAASHYPGVIGCMYTTWNKDFTQMEPFAQLIDKWKAGRPDINPRTGDFPYISPRDQQ